MELGGVAWLVLGAPAGLVLGGWAGLSGYSGWPLVVPVLYVVVGVPLYESLAASLCVDWVNAAVGSTVYLHRGDAEVQTAWPWILLSAPLAAAGAGASLLMLHRADALLEGGAGLVALVLGTVLVVKAFRMQEDPAEAVLAAGAGPLPVPVAAAPAAATASRLGFGLGASANGVAMGLLGIGGGFNLALLLVLLRGYPTRRAVGTGLLFCAAVIPVPLLVFLAHLEFRLEVLPALLPFCACAALGSALAAWQAGRLRARQLGLLVGACVLSAGASATLRPWMLPS